MYRRRSDHDVTNKVRVTDADPVKRAVCRIYVKTFPGASTGLLERAFDDFSRLFHGRYPGYLACDTPYHDMQHTLDMTLAMARIISGFERSHGHDDRMGPDLACLGLIVALFHDSGYIRRRMDRHHANGAEYTDTHVSRSERFLANYLPSIGLDAMVQHARKIVHFTGYEMALHDIHLPDPKLNRLGCMLGTADLLAQMADRCYLEKCRDRLFPEFVLSGRATADKTGIRKTSTEIFVSAEDMLSKTPAFMHHAIHDRLNDCLQSVHRHVAAHFPGRHYYMEAIEQNRIHLEQVLTKQDFSRLRRRPPCTLPGQEYPMNPAAGK